MTAESIFATAQWRGKPGRVAALGVAWIVGVRVSGSEGNFLFEWITKLSKLNVKQIKTYHYKSLCTERCFCLYAIYSVFLTLLKESR